MRSALAVVFFLMASLFAENALADKCPANAAEASRAVWPRGTIKQDQRVTGKHPCGRRISCTGGATTAAGSRACRWS